MRIRVLCNAVAWRTWFWIALFVSADDEVDELDGL